MRDTINAHIEFVTAKFWSGIFRVCMTGASVSHWLGDTFTDAAQSCLKRIEKIVAETDEEPKR